MPADAVTSTFVVYGGKGMGKTNLGAVLVEEFAAKGLRWSALDPMGVWWGMRHSADGKGDGVESLILGGAHGDIPIEPTGGAVIADLVVDETANVIIDISRNVDGEMWTIAERIRFVTDYGKQLYRRQGSLVNGQRREPICQVIDEAARFIPQMIRAGQAEVAACAGIWSAIVEEGRNVGLGIVLLTQRSARLNKDVAELADVMLAFRTVGPNSIGAVMDWLGEHVPKERVRELVQTVRALPRGSCLAVSPGWLGLEKVIAIRRRQTFDSSATPKPGEQAAKVKGEGARPDLGVYAERMQATIERAKENDPKALKLRIRVLEEALEAKGGADMGMSEDVAAMERELVELRPLKETLPHFLGMFDNGLAGCQSAMNECVEMIREMRESVLQEKARVEGGVSARGGEEQRQVQPQRPRLPAGLSTAAASAPPSVEMTHRGGAGVGMSKAERAILTVLRQCGVSSKAKTAAVAGYAVNGGGFNNALSACRSKGWMTGSDPLEITPDGQKSLGSVQPLPRGRALLDVWLGKVGKAEGTILEVLAKHRQVGKERLAEMTGYAASGGGFNNALSRLRTLELIVGSQEISLTKDFAEAIR